MTDEMQSFWNVYPKKNLPQYLFVRINILGAGEYWGSNLNGDFFPEEALKKYHKTFHQARIYVNHDHDNVDKSVGKVIFSVYNDADYAKRVEIIAAISRTDPRASKIIEDIESGKGIKVSMGCKVPYDECSICHNIAATRKQYCTHLKLEMNRILPDGKLVCAINDHPAFFDASAVVVEADPSSGFMEKVASLSILKKRAAAAKVGTMTKGDDEEDKKEDIIEDESVSGEDAYDLEEAGRSLMDSDPKLPEDILMRLSDFPMKEIMGTMSNMHIPLKNPEYTFIIINKNAGPQDARHFYRQGGCIASEFPSAGKSFDPFEDHSSMIEKIMMPFMQSRSMFPRFAQKRIVINIVPSGDPGPIMKLGSAGSLYSAYKRDSSLISTSKIACLLRTRPSLRYAITGEAGASLVKSASVTAYTPSISIARIMLKGAYRV